MHKTYRKAWVKAEEFLRQGMKLWKSSSSGEMVDKVMQEAYNVLSYLPWSGNVCGFDDNEPLHTLATYASRAWLSTLHENQMLDLLRHDLLLTRSNIEIGNMAFFITRRKAYDCRDTGEYDESNHFARTQSIAQALEMGQRDGFGTMVHINGDHWIAITLDFKNSLIWYGDSFDNAAVEDVTSVINWWTFHHTGREFAYRKMKMSAQTVGFSCGLLGTNGLGHFYMPEKYPLIDVARVDVERVRILLRVVQRHLNQDDVSPIALNNWSC